MSMQLRSSDLRRHVRVDFQRRAWCEHRDWTLYLPLTNLSHSGLFIQTSTSFASGEMLRVCLTDRDPLIIIDVEVMWCSAGGSSLVREAAARPDARVGVGCAIRSFVQGAESYAELVEQLTPGTR
jgi:Tfp pilus assembly protein PilZ